MPPDSPTLTTMLLTPSRTAGPASAAGPDASVCGCPFCDQDLSASTSPFDMVLAQSAGARLLPALGMMVPGYFMVSTRGHYLSVADMGGEEGSRLHDWVAHLVDRLGREFGDYLVFEHGSCATDSGGSCVDHAHLHLVPMAAALSAPLLAAFPWRGLASSSDLAAMRGRSYLYLGIGGLHRVVPEAGVRSQWLRRQMASRLGTDVWDWAVDPGEANLAETMRRLSRVRL